VVVVVVVVDLCSVGVDGVRSASSTDSTSSLVWTDVEVDRQLADDLGDVRSNSAYNTIQYKIAFVERYLRSVQER